MTPRSKMTSLLLELTLMLLIFSLCAGVCLRAFVLARDMSTNSARLSWAASWAQSAAQAYKAAGGDAVETARLLGADETETGLVLAFGEDWQATDFSQGLFFLTLEGAAGSCEIRVTEGEERLFTLAVKAVPHE